MGGCDTQQSVDAIWVLEGQDTGQVWFKADFRENLELSTCG